MAISPAQPTPAPVPGTPVTSRTKQIGKLSGQLPGVINRNVQSAQNSQMLQLQQAVQRTVGSGQQVTQGQIQGTGGQVAQAKGRAGLQQVQQGAQAQNQLAQLGVNEQQQQRNYELAQKQIQLEKDNRGLVNELDSLNGRLKNELFDKQQEFAKDELGRTAFNLRQLMDYQLTVAKDAEALKNFELEVTQQSQLRMQLLQAAHRKIVQSLEQANRFSEFDKDATVKKELARAKAALEEKMRKEAAQQKNRASMFAAGGAIAGAAAGAVLALPTGGMSVAAGAAAGAGLGQGVGSMAGAATN